ncbi:MAG TPA: hypothetical protein VFR94_08390 [Nitrososphaeraceae archaeon]|nr:hypothetical protein [Nitrososphaeraceae archaeon]
MDAQTQRTLTIFALIAALGVLSVEVVDLVMFLEAEAKGCENGAAPSTAVNASKGRCFGH